MKWSPFLFLFAISFVNANDSKIMIFGGEKHDVYLGCLNCSETASDSIFNSNGKFGKCSGIYDDNLFCRGIYKEFGGKGIYKDQSACGSNASEPPVIVDENGGYYGRFSLGGIYGHNDSVCAGIYGGFRHQGTCEIVQWVCEQ
jgi:hypothetical protein